MEKLSFLLPTIIVIITSTTLGQSESTDSSLTREPTFTPSTYIDTGAWLAIPDLSSVLTDPNEISSSEEAMFATYSFSHTGTTYNVELYYRELYNRVRARVLVGDQELCGLFNRFYGVDARRRKMLSVSGRDGILKVSLNFGWLSLIESELNTDAIYNAVETFAGKSFPQTHSLWIQVSPPPGMLKKTCIARLGALYLVNEQGQIGPLTLKNLLNAYCQEEIRAKQPDDFERIGYSLVEVHSKSLGFINTVVSDVNDIRKYSRQLLESVNTDEIKAPAHHRDDESRIDYWTCYACARYKMGPAILVRYKFGFQDGLLCSGERALLKEDATGAYTGYPNLTSMRVEEKVILDQHSEFEEEAISDRDREFKNGNTNSGSATERSLRTNKTIDTNPLLSVVGLRIAFVLAGIFLLVLAYVARMYVRAGSRVPKDGANG